LKKYGKKFEKCAETLHPDFNPAFLAPREASAFDGIVFAAQVFASRHHVYRTRPSPQNNVRKMYVLWYSRVANVHVSHPLGSLQLLHSRLQMLVSNCTGAQYSWF